MIIVKVSDEAIARARTRDVGQTAIELPLETWGGFLGEDVVADLLVNHGLGVVQNGGMDDLPDLVVEGLTVDVKTRLRNGEMRAGDDVTYTAAYLRRPATDLIVFCAHNPGERQLTLIGGRSSVRFFSEARFVRKGGVIPGSSRPALEDAFLLPAASLLPFNELLAWLKQRKDTP